VLRSAAAANPDKLEYVEPPVQKTVQKTVHAEVAFSVTFAPGADIEAEFKAWCEANGKAYVPYIQRYTIRADEYHTAYGDPTVEAERLLDARAALVQEWYRSLADAKDPRVKFSTGGNAADFGDSAPGQKKGRGRLVCKTAQTETPAS
jgi:hypothetical protein